MQFVSNRMFFRCFFIFLFIFLFSFIFYSFAFLQAQEEGKKSPSPVLSQNNSGNLPSDELIAPEEKVRREAINRSLGSAESLTWGMFKLVSVLLFVCLLAFFLLRYLLPKLSGFSPSGHPLIRVTTRFPLEPRKSLYVIQAGSGYHLIGVSEQNINYLAKIPKEQIEAHLDEMNQSVGKGGKGVQSFLKLLQRRESIPNNEIKSDSIQSNTVD